MTIVFVAQHELDAVADKAQEAFTGHGRHDWNGSFHLKSFYHEDAKREMQKRFVEFAARFFTLNYAGVALNWQRSCLIFVIWLGILRHGHTDYNCGRRISIAADN
jgi:hypothetical protein